MAARPMVEGFFCFIERRTGTTVKQNGARGKQRKKAIGKKTDFLPRRLAPQLLSRNKITPKLNQRRGRRHPRKHAEKAAERANNLHCSSSAPTSFTDT
jgi:hypothetical protein